MRLAIGWVNSGLSMMTTASGSAATAAAAVPWTRRRIVGRRREDGAPAPSPPRPRCGNCEARPCCGHVRAADAEIADAAAAALVRAPPSAWRRARRPNARPPPGRAAGPAPRRNRPSRAAVIAGCRRHALRSACPFRGITPRTAPGTARAVGEPRRRLVGRQRRGRPRDGDARKPLRRGLREQGFERGRIAVSSSTRHTSTPSRRCRARPHCRKRRRRAPAWPMTPSAASIARI